MARVKINKERCKGCGLCVITCHKKLISLEGPVNSMGLKTALCRRLKECVGCGMCAIMCPDCAIVVWR